MYFITFAFLSLDHELVHWLLYNSPLVCLYALWVKFSRPYELCTLIFTKQVGWNKKNPKTTWTLIKKEKKKKLAKKNVRAFWANLVSKLFSIVFFFLFWWEKFWWACRENTQAPPSIFFSPHQNKHTLKKFFFLVSFQSFPSTLFYLQTNTLLGFHLWVILGTQLTPQLLS